MTSFLIMLTLFSVWMIVILLWYLVIKPLFFVIAWIVLFIVEQFVKLGHVTHKHCSIHWQHFWDRQYAKRPKKKPEEMDDFDRLLEACGGNTTRLVMALQKKWEQEGI